MKIDFEGYRFFAAFLGIGSIFGAIYGLTGLQVFLWILGLFVFLALFTLYFFRDPERLSNEDGVVAISSADGVVADVSRVEADGFDDGEAMRIAVLMNVFNVHVNRMPIAGSVIGTKLVPGKKLSVYNDRAEYENEHGDTEIDTAHGLMRIRQIAGLVARRVVTRVKQGDVLNRGDRIGLIRFGSRVDVFLPMSFEPLVKKGQQVQAGATSIARLKAQTD